MKDFGNSSSNQLHTVQPAFVIKNYIPYSCKVLLLHREFGKIVCMFPRSHQATLLTTGSLVWCQLQKTGTVYSFLDLEIEYATSWSQLQFVHEIMLLCLQRIPRDIAAPELFDFLLYVHNNLASLSDKGHHVVMLRLFLMFDLLPEEHEIYRVATLDPYGSIHHDIDLLESHVARCWDNFYLHDQR